MRKYLAEVIGTFALVFAGTGAMIVNDVRGGAVTHVGIALTFGLIVMTMIYALGDVSGAHLNPAVTVGFYAAKRFPLKCVLPYVLCQFGGAFAASVVLRLMFADHPTLGATLPYGSPLRSFVLELILTAVLMLTILSVASGAKEKGITAGIAVGGVIALEAMFAGPICGASMNPARSVAPAVVSGAVGSLWVYVLAPVAGAVIVAPWHRWFFDCDQREETSEGREPASNS